MGYNLNVYLDDCTFYDGEPLSLLSSFAALVKADLSLDDPTNENIKDAIIRSGCIVPRFILEENTRLTREIFALAPLRFLAPYIEAMYDEEEIERWYDKAVEVAAILTNDHTNDSCLAEDTRPSTSKLRASDGDRCELSLNCPLKEMQLLLGASAVNYDKDNLEYTHNRDRYIYVSNAKMGLAAIRGLVNPYYGSALLRARDVRVFDRTTMEE